MLRPDEVIDACKGKKINQREQAALLKMLANIRPTQEAWTFFRAKDQTKFWEFVQGYSAKPGNLYVSTLRILMSRLKPAANGDRSGELTLVKDELRSHLRDSNRIETITNLFVKFDKLGASTSVLMKGVEQDQNINRLAKLCLRSISSEAEDNVALTAWERERGIFTHRFLYHIDLVRFFELQSKYSTCSNSIHTQLHLLI